MNIQLLEKGFTVLTKKDCSYCTKVKELLIQKEDTTLLIIPCEKEWREDRAGFLQGVKEKAGIIDAEIKTFPIVFLDGKWIGGFTETAKYFQEKEAFTQDFDF